MLLAFVNIFFGDAVNDFKSFREAIRYCFIQVKSCIQYELGFKHIAFAWKFSAFAACMLAFIYGFLFENYDLVDSLRISIADGLFVLIGPFLLLAFFPIFLWKDILFSIMRILDYKWLKRKSNKHPGTDLESPFYPFLMLAGLLEILLIALCLTVVFLFMHLLDIIHPGSFTDYLAS